MIFIEASVTTTIYKGEPLTLAYLRDITVRKHLENQLRQSQKMEAIGTLAGGVAHDLNNILTVLMGYGSLLDMGLDRDSPLRAYADQILASSRNAANLTQSLLTFSRQTARGPLGGQAERDGEEDGRASRQATDRRHHSQDLAQRRRHDYPGRCNPD